MIDSSVPRLLVSRLIRRPGLSGLRRLRPDCEPVVSGFYSDASMYGCADTVYLDLDSVQYFVLLDFMFIGCEVYRLILRVCLAKGFYNSKICNIQFKDKRFIKKNTFGVFKS